MKNDRDNQKIKITDYITGKPGYVTVYHDIIDTPGDFLCGEEKMLYIILLRFFNKDKQYAFPSFTRIQQLTNWSKNTVIKYIKSLEEKGVIKRNTDIYRKEQNNQYTIYDIELISQPEKNKKQFFYDSLMLHIKHEAQDKEFHEGYNQLRNFFEEIYKREKIYIDGQALEITDFFERVAPVPPDRLLTVLYRVQEKESQGEVKNKINYLIKSFYESSLTESVL